MKIGLALPYTDPRTVANLAQLAEEGGWDGCFLGDAIWCYDPMINLAAAAMVTSRIRLGTMIVPVPLRKPWKLASESLALDHLSGGRMILGLGTGATWMGWHAFPDEVTEGKARAEMLDETIDILALLYQRVQFDYEGAHYHLKLTQLDLQYYPPKPVHQPRVPLWAVGIWPSQKSMRRALKCDGIFVEKRGPGNQIEEVTPEDVSSVAAFVADNRETDSPFDIVMSGTLHKMNPQQQVTQAHTWHEAGATWWIEGLWEEDSQTVEAIIRQGPPRLENH
jgi:alkanesulfonate monooxygenase SsuD/methylene tetrahydromethanopterin reductase-like flavin-dependent oxidoreductase (luciferase family)